MSSSFSRTGLGVFFYLLLETFIFIGLTSIIGFWSTMAISIGTTLLGWLIRPRRWKACLESLGQGRLPPIASCYAPGQWQRMSASFLLILPGILTDVIGILILIPYGNLLSRSSGRAFYASLAGKAARQWGAGLTLETPEKQWASAQFPSFNVPINKATLTSKSSS